MSEQKLLFVKDWINDRGTLPNKAKPIPYDGPKPKKVCCAPWRLGSLRR